MKIDHSENIFLKLNSKQQNFWMTKKIRKKCLLKNLNLSEKIHPEHKYIVIFLKKKGENISVQNIDGWAQKIKRT